MVESEAIKKLRQHFEYLKHAWKPHPDYETMDAIGYAIQALEKQIAKKPMISYDERVKENWCSCGVCAFGLGWKRTIHYKYCPDCGQRLNWGCEE